MKVHICAPDIHPGDAVGNHCLGIARMCSRIGIESVLYARNFPAFHPEICEIKELELSISPEDVLVLSYSIFDPWLECLLQLPGRKICYFHGVTDPDLLRENEPETALLCEKSIAQLPDLARFDTLIINSLHTAQTLPPEVTTKVTIIPPVFADMPVFGRVAKATSDNRQRKMLLVVGRVVSHKRIEDAIELLADIRTLGYDYNIAVVGSMPNPKYSKYLFNYARTLGVLDSVSFNGAVANEDLFDLYQNALAYLSMSKHEGFCVPVLEAMHFGVPVVVRAGTAAQEVCDMSGVILSKESNQANAKVVVDRLSRVNIYEELQKSGGLRSKQILMLAKDDIWKGLITQQ
jgi:glycosyltransferase involved in cell wall biosynthesis